MPSRSQKKSKAPLRDLASFRGSLWNALAKNAGHLSGSQVVQALRDVSDDIYHAGVDAAYTRTRVQDPQNLADAWDLTWLTALNIKLLHLERSKTRLKRSR
jgi:hypothetical protein